MADNSTSSQIYLSRDQLIQYMAENAQTYLDLQNVDLIKPSLISYFINTMGTLASNLLFYGSSNFKEYFITLAQIPESIYNHASGLGYNSVEATYSTSTILITMPLDFNPSTCQFTIPEGFKFYAGSIPFSTYYDIIINITNNTNVKIIANSDNKIYDVPVIIDSTSNEFSFLIHLCQYEIVENEYSVPSDIVPYQFFDINVPITGQLSTMTVDVTPEKSHLSTRYTEFNSLYFMAATDYGYVSQKTSTGRKVSFGNGLLGKQPSANSKIIITTYQTLGEEGKVIAGTITTGERIYVSTDNGTKVVEYTCINPSSSTGGKNEEDINEIRSNTIKNLTSKKRLVTEDDFKNTNVIIPNVSIFQNGTLPVLKRSDVKCNEIQLFTLLKYADKIVPTRNLKYTVNNTVTRIPKMSLLTTEGVDSTFYNIFDIEIDRINGSAYYYYIASNLIINPTVNVLYDNTYTKLSVTSININNIGNSIIIDIPYNGSDTTSICIMEILETNNSYIMSNDSTNSKFTYNFTPYKLFPTGEITAYFTLYSNSKAVVKYSTKFTFSKNLKYYMMSNIVSDSSTTTIYDIPTIEKTYYDSLKDKENFELELNQTLLSNIDFNSTRMMTDFINIKFPNTIGKIVNMSKNYTNKQSIKNFINMIPSSARINDRYIIGTTPVEELKNYKNYYVQCIGIDSTTPIWSYTKPLTDDIVYASELDHKYIFNGISWAIPEFNSPITITLDVFKSTDYFGTDAALSNLIKNTLVSKLSSKFGLNCEIYKSEIIDVVHNIPGVKHCNLLSPTSNIFFNFNFDNFTQKELLEYAPEYIYFTKDNIHINLI